MTTYTVSGTTLGFFSHHSTPKAGTGIAGNYKTGEREYHQSPIPGTGGFLSTYDGWKSGRRQIRNAQELALDNARDLRKRLIKHFTGQQHQALGGTTQPEPQSTIAANPTEYALSDPAPVMADPGVQNPCNKSLDTAHRPEAVRQGNEPGVRAFGRSSRSSRKSSGLMSITGSGSATSSSPSHASSRKRQTPPSPDRSDLHAHKEQPNKFTSRRVIGYVDNGDNAPVPPDEVASIPDGWYPYPDGTRGTGRMVHGRKSCIKPKTSIAKRTTYKGNLSIMAFTSPLNFKMNLHESFYSNPFLASYCHLLVCTSMFT